MNKVAVIILFATFVAGKSSVHSPYGTIAQKLPKKSHETSDGPQIVTQRLLNRIANIFSQGGDGSEGGQENEGDSIVDSTLLDRIARIINQNEGQTSVPAPEGRVLATEYGVPDGISAKLVGEGSFELGQPFAARRIASFHYTDEEEDHTSIYNNEISSYNNAYPAALPIRGRGGERNGKFEFTTTPQRSQRISAFSFPEGDLSNGTGEKEEAN